MFIAKHRNTFLIITLITTVLAAISIFVFGLRQGIEFTGGTAINVVVEQGQIEKESLEDFLSKRLPSDSSISIQELGEDGYIIRTSFLSEEERSSVVTSLEEEMNITVDQLSSVGPTIGAELQKKSIVAVILVTIAIVLFVAFAFRQVSKPVSSWAYGGATILSQAYDILFTTGVFALFGIFFGAEVDSLFIIALLTILGYSVNDTIVVFDRIRENLKVNEDKRTKEDFDITVGNSINQTITRSINTSLTTSLALLALYVFGGEPTKIFALTLLVGVISGTYSSIFFASPLLLLFNQLAEKNKEKGVKGNKAKK